MNAVAFPTIVWLGSMTGAYWMDAPRGGATRHAFIPYMLHYPFYHWWEGFRASGRENGISLLMVPPVAYAVLRLYDQPFRERLRTFVLG